MASCSPPALPASWVTPYDFGIDQGPVVLMVENYRRGLLWNVMRRCPAASPDRGGQDARAVGFSRMFQRPLGALAADALTVNPIYSPCVAKLQIDAATVPDPFCVLEIHEHALRGFDHEVQAGSDGRIDAAVERDGGIAIQRSRA
jgi:hypothetical protein